MNLKKSVILLIVLIFSMSSSVRAAGNAMASEYVHHEWKAVINAIIHVESEGNHRARNGRYAGAMQIAPIVVKECNLILKEKNLDRRFSLNDRFDVRKSKEMFCLLQEKYNPEKNVETAIRLWNGGPRFDKKSTNTYYNKVMAAMNK